MIAIVGGGSWGTALAIHLARSAGAVRLWARGPGGVEGVRAREVAVGRPTAAVIASRDDALAGELQKRLGAREFRLYANRDVVGVETGGALKNVMAIATGLVDGLGLGENARAALITRGLAEMTRL